MCSAIPEREKEESRRKSCAIRENKHIKYKQKEIHEKVKIQSNNNNKIYENNQLMIYPVQQSQAKDI